MLLVFAGKYTDSIRLSGKISYLPFTFSPDLYENNKSKSKTNHIRHLSFLPYRNLELCPQGDMAMPFCIVWKTFLYLPLLP